MKFWKKHISLLIVVTILCMPYTGCAIFLLGAGAAGGYAISKDEIEGFLDTPFDKVWRASKEVLAKEGSITLLDKEHGKQQAVVESSTVEVNIEPTTVKTLRLRVKARKTKGLFPDIKRAQNIYTRIIKKLG